MKHVLPFLFLLIVCCTSACQSKKQKPGFESLGIELLQGDLVLCSGEQFGDVRFTFSSDNSVREAFELAVSLLHSFE